MSKHLLHIFSTFDVGGPQVRTCEIINHFGPKYKHTILAMDSHYEAKGKLKPGIEVNFLQLKFNKKNTFRNVISFRRTLKKINPDLLLTYNWGAIEWAIANHFSPLCPHIHIEEGFRPDELYAQKRRRIWTRRLFLSHVLAVIVPSLTLKEIALQTWKLKPGMVQFVPNGVDCAKYARAGKSKSLGQGDIIIGTVAPLRKEKNLGRLIRIFSRLPADIGAELWIVGDGPEYTALKEFIAEKRSRGRVRLLGYKEDPSEIIKKFDIFCISSDTEQMPISVLEAMAAGSPIVGTDVGDIKQMVTEENRPYIVNKEDETGFASFLKQLINDAPLRSRLGAKNQARCRKYYNKDLMFQAYGRLYDMAR
ncbi:MAG: glycosyltransferase family 4 protein [bacterium]